MAPAPAGAVQLGKEPIGLRAECLSYPAVLAQSVAVIAPSTVPAAILGLIFASAGNGTWLSFLLGMVGLTFVSMNINQFARCSSSSGSLYKYVVIGLGPTVGLVCGCALLFGYMLTGMSTLCGFAISLGGLLQEAGLNIPPMLLSTAAVVLAFSLSVRDVRLSTQVMLILEAAAIAGILALGGVVLWHKGLVLDHRQLGLSHVNPGGVLIGVVLVVFGFSGFESATSLGDEAKEPLRTIPRSVMQSVLLSGGVFIFMAYAIVLGFQDLPANLATSVLPLSVLSNHYNLQWLGEFINVGVILSFFSCTLASIGATGRIVFSMARHDLVPRALGKVDGRHNAPYFALGFAALLTLLVTLCLSLARISAFDAQGYLGSLSSFGFLVVYILISVAAPVYLRNQGRLTKQSILVSVLSLLFMSVPLLGSIGIPGSVMFAPPAFPSNMLVWIFLGFIVLSVGWLAMLQNARAKDIIEVFDKP